MYVPEFNSIEDVQKFLRYGGDAWCRPMIEEYMELIALDTDVEDIDIEELNGWIEHEMSIFNQGYRDWGDENS
tara:strand:+ start:398 stop:616 length:219 start_codon:yes stop_codon:yes gene_type:complete